jgi:uncharacterized protein YhhL (DUF1145 family)
MFNLVIGTTKALLLAFWLAWILSLFSLIPDPYGRFVAWAGPILLLVHLVEYPIVRSRSTQPESVDFVRTMAFGFAHWLPLLRAGRQ